MVRSRHPGRYPKLEGSALSHPAFEPLTLGYDLLGNRTVVDNLNTANMPHVVLTSDYDALSRRVSLAANINGADDSVNNYLYDELSRMISVEPTSVGTGSLPVQDKQVNFTNNAATGTSLILIRQTRMSVTMRALGFSISDRSRPFCL